MTYAVQADLVNRFGTAELEQLTDRIEGTVIDAAVLNRSLADADAEIDGYLAARYLLPLSSTPPVLVRLASDIARYRLYEDRVTDEVRHRYQEAIDFLKQVSKGTVVIDGALALTPSGSSICVKAITPDKVFNADLLSQY